MPVCGSILYFRAAMFCTLAFACLCGSARAVTIVVDNDNAINSAGTFSLVSGPAWTVSGVPTFVGQWADDYTSRGTSDPASVVEWRPTLPAAGAYEVAVWFRTIGSGRPNNARYSVDHAGGSTDVVINQQVNGSIWVSLGTFNFNAGSAGRVTLTSVAQAGKTIVADAVRLRTPGEGPPSRLAGMRVSSIPFSPFPQPPFFIETANCMTTKAPQAAPGLIWIVSLYWDDGEIGLNFPNPTGQAQPYMNFSSTDKNEAHLTAFDAAGVNVWLQVEPGDADMEDLIDIVLNKYKHHPCVIGFGVDVEWFNTTVVSTGRQVTDLEAQSWNTRIKAHNPNYRLFLKHYITSRMPPTYRGDVLFVDDSQGYPSLASMVNSFTNWANALSPAQVGYQYGYPNDRPWWSQYADPAGTLTAALDNAIPTADAFFWVDFTIEEITPIDNPPDITLQPQAQSVPPGASAVFTVGAAAIGSPDYAWRRNGEPLMDGADFSGTATAQLTVLDVNASVTGTYDCVITDGCGIATSAGAALTLKLIGDIDGDGDVDAHDAWLLTVCIHGPDVVYLPAHPCTRADANGDRDIDLADVAIFQQTFGQP